MGFDTECIPNFEYLPMEFFCPVCGLLVYPNEALQSMCTHLYCSRCLAYVASTTRACPYDGYLVTETDAEPLVESNQVLAVTIGEIVVCCAYVRSGCTWVGSLSEIPSHCSTCAFGTCIVKCNICDIQIQHRQAEEHAEICPGRQQVLVLEDLYQQQYQPYYQNYTGYYYMHQPHDGVPTMIIPHLPWQHQVPYVAEPHFHVEADQQQLQSQSLTLHHPHDLFPSPPHNGAASPQAYPSTPPSPQDLSQTFPPSQAQTPSQTPPLSQALPFQYLQVPQHQQLHEQITSHQLHIPNHMHPQANTVRVGSPPNNMPVYHQVGSQSPQILPPQFPPVHPPHSPPTMQTQQPSQLTRDQYSQHLVRTYGGVPLSESSVMHPHRSAPTTDAVHNQIHHQGGSFFNPHIATQSHLRRMHGLQNHPPAFQVHQLITPNHGLQPQMNRHPATAFPGGSGHAATCIPGFPAVKKTDMEGTQNQVPQDHTGDEATNGVNGVKHAVEIIATKSNHDLKGKRIDACASSYYGSSKVVVGNEIKIEDRGKQVMEDNVGNGRENLGKTHVVEKNGTDDDPSLNATPLEPTSLGPDGIRHLKIVFEQFLESSHTYSDGFLKFKASSSRSLERGFDQRSPLVPHEKHVSNHIRGGELKEGFGFDGNALRLGNLGFTGDGGSYSGDVGPFPDSRKRAAGPDEGLDLTSQTEEHQQESMDTVLVTNQNAKKLKIAHADTSPCINPKQIDESGSGGLG